MKTEGMYTMRRILTVAASLLLLASCQKSVTQERATGAVGIGQEKGLITFIELGSVNCIPCKAMQPILEEVRTKHGDQVKVVFHDVWTDEGKPFSSTFKVRVIPTQVFLDRDGKEYYRHEGYLPLEDVIAALERGGLKR
jgi:thioredoxin 1